jgi:hypothetical protein
MPFLVCGKKNALGHAKQGVPISEVQRLGSRSPNSPFFLPQLIVDLMAEVKWQCFNCLHLTAIIQLHLVTLGPNMTQFPHSKSGELFPFCYCYLLLHNVLNLCYTATIIKSYPIRSRSHAHL